jgi:hypothetical protein
MRNHLLWIVLMLLWSVGAGAQTLTLHDVVYSVEVQGGEVRLRMHMLVDQCPHLSDPIIWERVPGGVVTRLYADDDCAPSGAGKEVTAYLGQFEPGPQTWFLHACGFNVEGWECNEYGQLVFQVPTVTVATVPASGPAANFGLGGLLMFLAWLALRYGRKPTD